MTEKQKQDVKQAVREFYRDRRITLETALWAMKNAGYTREETAEWLELEEKGHRGPGMNYAPIGQRRKS
jgi:hypothetical protein